MDLLKLSDNEFEELCFELVLSLSFEKVRWRKGGADNGRDIQAELSSNTTLVDRYYESWFFECKRYSKGVPPEQLNSKIAWADAEKPKHLVIFVSSYLTNNARTWLEKIETDKFYKIHVIEGDQVKRLVLCFPKLVEKYFSTEIEVLVSEAQKNWLMHKLIPEPELIRTIVEAESFLELSLDKIAFIWCVAKYRLNEINELIDDSYEFSMDSAFFPLSRNSNCSESVLSGELLGTTLSVCLLNEVEGTTFCDLTYNSAYSAEIAFLANDTDEHIALYSFVRDSEGEALEVIVIQNSSFPVYMRHIEGDAKIELKRVKQILNAV
ncbi:MAG: restriction endonuclease [Cellvibrionaceae bacterium]